jgi:hypothetical protein
MELSPFVFVVIVLAAYRVIRLWLYDTIAAPFNRWVMTRLIGDTGNKVRWWLAELLGCQWCIGVWVGFGAAAAWFTVADLWTGLESVVAWLAVALAIAAGQSFLHLLEDALSDD